jgi:hypothetical protein
VGSGSLEHLQRLVVDAVMRPLPVASDPDAVDVAERLLVSSKRGMDRVDRLEVYREQFWLRHLKCLAEDFPTLTWVIGGADRFRELARDYLLAHPPRTWNLQRLGADLPTYVARQAPWSSDALALDAAVLDWAFMEAFDAPDAPPLDLSRLASAPAEALPGMRITFHPSLRRVVTGHPVHQLRDALRHPADCGRPGAGDTQAVVWRNPTCVLCCEAIESTAAELMSALQSSEPLGLACEAVAKAHPELDAALLESKVGVWFQQWTANGWVSSLNL